jgi:hypothetical protein
MNGIQLIQTTNNFVIKLIWQNFFLAASRIYHQMATGFPHEMFFLIIHCHMAYDSTIKEKY